MNFRNVGRITAAAGLIALTACETSLEVPNEDQPNIQRALSTPDGIRAILSNGFSQMLGATHATSTAVQVGAHVMSFESYGSVANFGMALRATIPRTPIDNSKGNTTQAETLRDFEQLSLRGRTLAKAITALDQLTAGGGTLGSAAENARARSFGFFALAISNGHMALVYDSVGVSTPALTDIEIPPLTGYADAMTVALAQIDTAIKIAQDAQAAGNGFTLPTSWLRTRGGALGVADYIRFMRSIKARLRANVARSPAERAAVDWNQVIADAQNGITADLVLDLNSNEGWGNQWINEAARFIGWHGMTPYIIGMADTSGSYDAWLATGRAARDGKVFIIHTPDTRFPAGATRAAQLAASPAADAELPGVYFRNRAPGDDTPGEAWGLSPYDFVRFRSYRQKSQIGPWVYMSSEEVDMLRAEGLMRLNRDAEAMPLINASRTAHGLEPFPAGSTKDTPAPLEVAGRPNSCVPRTPTGPGGSIVCGSMYEAMKWEKRMETLFTGYAAWFMDSRGWGDLTVGTPVNWPVPYQELDARRAAIYSSQTGDNWIAPSSTYGFGVGTR